MDIESIERATLSAVSPQALEEIPDWLLPFDSGTVGRAKSAVPVSHGALMRRCCLRSKQFSPGWASVHGMRTAQDRRGRGLAGRVLAALADAARSNGYARMFLQVEAHNAAALALYERSGFQLAWTYAYWQKAG